MPIKLSEAQPSILLRDRIDALRKTIKRGEGITTAEVAEKLGVTASSVNQILKRNGWGLMMIPAGHPQAVRLLVNPADQKEYAK